MVEATPGEPRKMPKGGRRGGKRFPQYPLEDAIKWAEKLVSKTHSGPQAEDLVKASVVEAKSGVGDVRISALKQFDLMAGSSKGYTATLLSKEIKSAPPDERFRLYERAALKPEIFKAIYDTYHGDSISFAKLKQRAADLQVHPDATAKCVEVYIDTLEFARLISRDGDLISHTSKNLDADDKQHDPQQDELASSLEQENLENKVSEEINTHGNKALTRRGAATVQVNINLDSSLDTEKLQKQLELLRRYGAL